MDVSHVTHGTLFLQLVDRVCAPRCSFVLPPSSLWHADTGTPLGWAAGAGLVDAVKLLLSKGAGKCRACAYVCRHITRMPPPPSSGPPCFISEH